MKKGQFYHPHQPKTFQANFPDISYLSHSCSPKQVEVTVKELGQKWGANRMRMKGTGWVKILTKQIPSPFSFFLHS
jgi:hypothetical protein